MSIFQTLGILGQQAAPMIGEAVQQRNAEQEKKANLARLQGYLKLQQQGEARRMEEFAMRSRQQQQELAKPKVLHMIQSGTKTIALMQDPSGRVYPQTFDSSNPEEDAKVDKAALSLIGSLPPELQQQSKDLYAFSIANGGDRKNALVDLRKGVSEAQKEAAQGKKDKATEERQAARDKAVADRQAASDKEKEKLQTERETAQDRRQLRGEEAMALRQLNQERAAQGLEAIRETHSDKQLNQRERFQDKEQKDRLIQSSGEEVSPAIKAMAEDWSKNNVKPPAKFQPAVSAYMKANKMSLGNKDNKPLTTQQQAGLDILKVSLMGDPKNPDPLKKEGLWQTVDVLDSGMSRVKLIAALSKPADSGMMGMLERQAKGAVTSTLTNKEQKFVDQMNRAIGDISALRAISGMPRSSEALIQRYMQELADPSATKNAKDARYKISLILRQLEVAKKTGQAPQEEENLDFQPNAK